MSDPKNISDVADKLVDKLSSGADHLAQAVNKIAPHAWEVLVRGQRVRGVCEAGFCIALLVCAACATRFVWRASQTVEDSEIAGAMRVGVCAAMAFVAAFSLWNLQEDVQRATCPEYYAAQELLEAIK